MNVTPIQDRNENTLPYIAWVFGHSVHLLRGVATTAGEGRAAAAATAALWPNPIQRPTALAFLRVCFTCRPTCLSASLFAGVQPRRNECSPALLTLADLCPMR